MTRLGNIILIFFNLFLMQVSISQLFIPIIYIDCSNVLDLQKLPVKSLKNILFQTLFLLFTVQKHFFTNPWHSASNLQERVFLNHQNIFFSHRRSETKYHCLYFCAKVRFFSNCFDDIIGIMTQNIHGTTCDQVYCNNLHFLFGVIQQLR